MYIHFEDWTAPWLLKLLEEKNLPHGNRIIKVYSTDQDPRIILGKSSLATVMADGSPFSASEEYSYKGRGTYSGPELESTLNTYRLTDLGHRTIRSLFRFAAQKGFNQAAMAAQKDDDWLISHPFGDIDGIEIAKHTPSRESLIHLDLFFPVSLVALRETVDYDDPTQVLSLKEVTNLIRQKYTDN